ncbi:hypothetical protein [Sphingomonas sp.]|uniref:hypothetical protein n=1 Tax=Sphingomonas sp. TaxID=28214 RepID=UPI0025DC07DF|nr:hypothetical protein [Sphingomonas sp.]
MASVGRARLGSSQHDGRQRGYQGPRVPPNLLRKSVPPASAARRGAMPRGPDSHTAARRRIAVLDAEDVKRRSEIMGMMESIGTGSDRVMAVLTAGLELEFGRNADEALAQQFLAAEACDFHWDAREEERWLGAYESIDDEEDELDRIAICGTLNGAWFVAQMIVDSNGRPHGMLGRRAFRSRKSARKALADAR